MELIRVLLAAHVLGDALKEAIAAQPDMELVGEVSDGIELMLAAGETAAEVVILEMQNDELPGICSHLLAEYPQLKILAVAPDHHGAVLYELRPHKVCIAQGSPWELLEAIREAVRDGVSCSSGNEMRS